MFCERNKVHSNQEPITWNKEDLSHKKFLEQTKNPLQGTKKTRADKKLLEQDALGLLRTAAPTWDSNTAVDR